jgi:hypothetical protein
MRELQPAFPVTAVSSVEVEPPLELAACVLPSKLFETLSFVSMPSMGSLPPAFSMVTSS